MKNRSSIILSVIVIATLACKENVKIFGKLEQELQEAESIKNNLEKYIKNTHTEQMREKKIIIAKLKSKIIRDKYILNMYNDNDDWIEDNILYRVNNQTVFQVAKDHKNDEVYASKNNKSVRKLIYLALEYRRFAIINFQTILNKLAQKANTNITYRQKEYDINTEYNILLENILSAIKKYAHNYFEVALIPLSQKQNDLHFLSLNNLQELKDKFDEIQKIRDTGKTYAMTIYNDFQNNKDNIRDGDATYLKNHINKMHYEYKLKELANKTEEIAYQISQILKLKLN
ncbi:virulence associated lipoprotein [Borrelia persica]|uniref:virulence associated lipoprotein n=1 Tax=Borrelia persica TaxID=44448 RepID=UPI0004665D46|nr:virulence associated lipoprotein [Borrelia persica]